MSAIYLKKSRCTKLIRVRNSTGCVGTLCPNTECSLKDDYGKEVQSGQPGEMYIRGPQVCLGYWRNEQATRETLSSDGWLRTGDVAVERDGWFWIVDRKKVLVYTIWSGQISCEHTNAKTGADQGEWASGSPGRTRGGLARARRHCRCRRRWNYAVG